MLRLIALLFDLLDRMGAYIVNQQLVNAGKAEQQVQAQQEVEQHVQQANAAVVNTGLDPAYAERLRNRFDDARADG